MVDEVWDITGYLLEGGPDGLETKLERGPRARELTWNSPRQGMLMTANAPFGDGRHGILKWGGGMFVLVRKKKSVISKDKQLWGRVMVKNSTNKE